MENPTLKPLPSNSSSFEHITLKETDPKKSSFTNDQTSQIEVKKNSISALSSIHDSESNFELLCKIPPSISVRKSCDFSRTCQIVNGTEKKDSKMHIVINDKSIVRGSDTRIRRKGNFSPIRSTEIRESPLIPQLEDFHLRIGSSIIKHKSKLSNLISQFYITEKFIQSLFNWTTYRKTKKLKKAHFEVINDLAFYPEGWESAKIHRNLVERRMGLNSFYKPLIKGIKEFLAKKKEHLVFHPTRFFRVFWDFLHFFLIVSYFIVIPLEMSFEVSIHNELPSSLMIVIILFFVVDILVNMNTAIYEQGKLTVNHRKIMINYFRSSFLFDSISILYFFDFSGEYNKYLGILFFLRIKTMGQIIKKIQGFVFMDETTYYLLYLIKLVLGVLFISHIFSCLWHCVATISAANNKDNWLDSLNLSKADWNVRYVNSFYFVVVVMNTVGFGDIVPRSDFEKIFAIFFIYFACYIFAFSLNIIGMIVQTLNKKSSTLNSALLTLNFYMSQKHIPLDLRVRIRKYLEFLFQEEELQTVEQAHAIINKLSPSLQEELLLSANGLPLRNIGIFSSLSEDSFRQLTLSLREVTLTPGDLLFPPAQLSPSIYIILSGEIELFLSIGGKEKGFCKMSMGGVLREKGFITGVGGEEGGRSLGFSKVMEVDRDKFLEIIKNNSRDFERFCAAKENTVFATKMGHNDQRCEGCGEGGHLVWECKWSSLNIRKQGIIARHCWDSGQKRTVWGRKRKKLNCLKMRKKCRDGVKDLRGELFSDEEEEEQEQEQEDDEEEFEESIEEKQNIKKFEQINSFEKFENSREYRILNNQVSFSNDRRFSKEIDREKPKGRSMIFSQLNKQSSGTIHTKSNKSHGSFIKSDGTVLVPSCFLKEKIGGSCHSFSERVLIGSGQISSETSSSNKNQIDVIYEDNKALTFGNDLAFNFHPILSKGSTEFERLTFERAKNYTNFLPHNNLEVILHKLDLELQRKLKRRKTFKKVESNITIIEKKIMEITMEKEREKKKNRSSEQNSSDLDGKEKIEKKEILTKEKIIIILKEIERRKRKKRSRIHRVKYWIKKKFINLIKLILKKIN